MSRQVGYIIETEGPEEVFCMDHRPTRDYRPVWELGIAAAMACNECSRRLDGADSPPRTAAEADEIVRSIMGERDFGV